MPFSIVFLSLTPADKVLIRNSPDCVIQVSLIFIFSAFVRVSAFFLVIYFLEY